MNVPGSIRRTVKRWPFLYRMAAFSYRARLAFSVMERTAAGLLKWLCRSREVTNFTYDLMDLNRRELACFVADLCDVSVGRVLGAFSELESDAELRAHIRTASASHREGVVTDREPRYGQRLAWYAAVRILRPAVCVEVGADKGLGTCAIAAALAQNEKEGSPGQLYVLDIDPGAGWLAGPPYSRHTKFVIGDANARARDVPAPIGLLVYDGLRDWKYEEATYSSLAGTLAPDAVLLTRTSHHCGALMDFAAERGLRYSSWRETPKDHFYVGAGLGAVAMSRRVRP